MNRACGKGSRGGRDRREQLKEPIEPHGAAPVAGRSRHRRDRGQAGLQFRRMILALGPIARLLVLMTRQPIAASAAPLSATYRRPAGIEGANPREVLPPPA